MTLGAGPLSRRMNISATAWASPRAVWRPLTGTSRVEAQVDVCVGKMPADLPVVQRRNLDGRVVQLSVEELAQVPVQHGDIERQVVAKQRPVADERQQLAQSLLQLQLSLQVGAAQLVDADRLRVQARRRLDVEFQALAHDQFAAPHQHRADAEDVGTTRVEAGGLEIEGDHFLRLDRLVHPPIQPAAPARPAAVGQLDHGVHRVSRWN